jgi:hypothetical protein
VKCDAKIHFCPLWSNNGQRRMRSKCPLSAKSGHSNNSAHMAGVLVTRGLGFVAPCESRGYLFLAPARRRLLMGCGGRPDLSAISRSWFIIKLHAGMSLSMPPSNPAGTRRLERCEPSSVLDHQKRTLSARPPVRLCQKRKERAKEKRSIFYAL